MTTEAFSVYIRRAIFDHLVSIAYKRETTTYEAIALAFNLPSKGNQLGSVLSPILGDVYRFCVSRELPPITSLVVRKSGASKGLPGEGFWTLFTQTSSLLDVFPREEITKDLHRNVFDFWSFDEFTGEVQ